MISAMALKVPPLSTIICCSPQALLLQAQQRLFSCQATCASLAHKLLQPAPDAPSPSSSIISSLHHVGDVEDVRCAAAVPYPSALSPAFILQLFAAVHTQHFSAVSLMIPAITAARTRATKAAISGRDQDLLFQALEVMLASSPFIALALLSFWPFPYLLYKITYGHYFIPFLLAQAVTWMKASLPPLIGRSFASSAVVAGKPALKRHVMLAHVRSHSSSPHRLHPASLLLVRRS